MQLDRELLQGPGMKTLARHFIVLGMLIAISAQAQAQPWMKARTQEHASPAQGSTWYGYKIMLADAASVATMLTGILSLESEPVFVAGMGGLALGGPLVHLAEDRPDRAIMSLALRVGAPLLVGLAIGEDESCEHSYTCSFEDQLTGAAAALGIVVAVDWLILSRHPHQAAPVERAPSPRLVPTVNVATNGASLGLAGHF